MDIRDLDGFVHIIDANTGEELHCLTGYTDTIWNTQFSPDGTQLATASDDGEWGLSRILPDDDLTPHSPQPCTARGRKMGHHA